jgi:hypothetical protein
MQIQRINRLHIIVSVNEDWADPGYFLKNYWMALSWNDLHVSIPIRKFIAQLVCGSQDIIFMLGRH